MGKTEASKESLAERQEQLPGHAAKESSAREVQEAPALAERSSLSSIQEHLPASGEPNADKDRETQHAVGESLPPAAAAPERTPRLRGAGRPAADDEEVDFRSMLFPSLASYEAPPPPDTQVFVEQDGSVRLEVHPAGGFRRGFGGNVLSAPRASGGFEVFGEGASSFLGLNGGGALRRGPAELRADVELEEFLLLQRLQQAGVGEGLQAELQRHLEAQLRHPLPGLGGGGASFSEGSESNVESTGVISSYMAAFSVGFGGILVASVLLCIARAIYVKHMKKRLEAEVAAMGLTPPPSAASKGLLASTEDSQENWEDVSVETEHPKIQPEVASLSSQASLGKAAPQRASSTRVSAQLALDGEAPEAKRSKDFGAALAGPSEQSSAEARSSKGSKSKKKKHKDKHKDEDKKKHSEKKSKSDKLDKKLSERRTLRLNV